MSLLFCTQESSNACSSNMETIFSPSLEPIEIHIEENTGSDPGTGVDE